MSQNDDSIKEGIKNVIVVYFCDDDKDKMVADVQQAWPFAKRIHDILVHHEKELFAQLRRAYRHEGTQLSFIRDVIRERRAEAATQRQLEGAMA